ncbi:hypothetical protein K438DRAFT_1777493 [Mycena galopus ATCC 62051]|nr:hypothetical protein K438DRAFT_1777493 [Mycena galopus ATCC 62051]
MIREEWPAIKRLPDQRHLSKIGYSTPGLTRSIATDSCQDWYAHKLANPWILPSINKFLSKISSENWDITPNHSNYVESAHAARNAETGTHLPLLTAILKAQERDDIKAQELALMERDGVMPNRWNGSAQREKLSAQRQKWAARKAAVRNDQLTSYDILKEERDSGVEENKASLERQKSLEAQIKLLQDETKEDIQDGGPRWILILDAADPGKGGRYLFGNLPLLIELGSANARRVLDQFRDHIHSPADIRTYFWSAKLQQSEKSEVDPAPKKRSKKQLTLHRNIQWPVKLDRHRTDLQEQIVALRKDVEAEKSIRREWAVRRAEIDKEIQRLRDSGLVGARLKGRRPREHPVRDDIPSLAAPEGDGARTSDDLDVGLEVFEKNAPVHGNADTFMGSENLGFVEQIGFNAPGSHWVGLAYPEWDSSSSTPTLLVIPLFIGTSSG